MAEDVSFSMVQEAVDSYSAIDLPDGSLQISIVIPRRFANLWLAKLGDLRATPAEVQSYSDSDGP